MMGEKSSANVRAMRVVLYLFEAMSGLKVNFHKSEMVGVNVSRSWLLEATVVLNCKISFVKFQRIIGKLLGLIGTSFVWRRRLVV